MNQYKETISTNQKTGIKERYTEDFNDAIVTPLSIIPESEKIWPLKNRNELYFGVIWYFNEINRLKDEYSLPSIEALTLKCDQIEFDLFDKLED